jgi:hypothetical protein
MEVYAPRVVFRLSPQKGKVSITFNNELVLDEKAMATLIKNEKPFLQLGILRDQQDATETIYLDDVSSQILNLR